MLATWAEKKERAFLSCTCTDNPSASENEELESNNGNRAPVYLSPFFPNLLSAVVRGVSKQQLRKYGGPAGSITTLT